MPGRLGGLVGILAVSVAPLLGGASAFPLRLHPSAVGAGPLQWIQPGDRVHVTGCVNGKLVALRVDIHAEPPGTISPWVARLRGTSRTRICDGEVVIVREVRRVRGDVAVLVEPVRQEVQGWLASQFLGAHFPLYRCHTHFEDEALVEKCLRGEPRP